MFCRHLCFWRVFTVPTLRDSRLYNQCHSALGLEQLNLLHPSETGPFLRKNVSNMSLLSPPQNDTGPQDKRPMWQKSIRMWSKSNKCSESQHPQRLMCRPNGHNMQLNGGPWGDPVISLFLLRPPLFLFCILPFFFC